VARAERTQVTNAKASSRPESPQVVRDVLVVDDSRAHLRLMASIMTRWGYTVHQADSGQAALDILQAGGIDLVLSDWVMPGMNGIELCENYRQSEGEQYVYFILLTSKNEGEDVARGLAAGADDFLSKPIDRSELRARIAAGERLIAMQRAVVEKNQLLEKTLGHLQNVYDGIARDLAEARRLQQSLVPDRQRRYPGAEVFLHLQPSGQVGGDLVGAFRIDSWKLGLYSIDVSGHGIASALLNARLAGYLSGTSPAHNLALKPDGKGGYDLYPPVEICQRLNSLLIADIETELYFTMVFVGLDLRTGRAELAQAGHPNPLVQRANGLVEFVGDGGMPIGLIDDAEFGQMELELAPGDRLLLYSDGFTEQTNPDGQMLDEDGLSQLALEYTDTQGGEFIDALVWSLSAHSGNTDFDDDLSGVLLEYTGEELTEKS